MIKLKPYGQREEGADLKTSKFIKLPAYRSSQPKRFFEDEPVEAPEVQKPNVWQRLFPDTTGAIQSIPEERKSVFKTFGESFISSIKRIGEGAKQIHEAPEQGGLPKYLSGVAGGFSKVIGGALAPVTATFESAGELPVVGKAVKAGVGVPFGVAGDVFRIGMEGVIDTLPISEQSKEELRPGFYETATLAGQIYFGRATHVKIKEIKAKYGKDAPAIIDAAEQLVAEKRKVDSIQAGGQQIAEINGVRIPVKPIIDEVNPAIPKKIRLPEYAEKPIDPLAKEAQKYETAEEFVKAQKPIYHGTPEVFDKFDVARMEGGQAWFTNSKKDILSGEAGAVQSAGQTMNIMERYIKPGLKFADEQTANKYYTDQLIDMGYAGKVVKGEGKTWYSLFEPNKDLLTKSQLTDFFNKVKGETVIPEVPKGKVSEVARQIEAKAIEEGLIKRGYNELAEYSPANIKAQSQMMFELMRDNIALAKKIVRGQEPIPEGLKGTTVLSAMEDYAMKMKDGALARDLAKSPLVSEISTAAQTLRLSAERTPDSATAKIKEVMKAREEAVAKKFKNTTPEQAKGKIKNAAKEKIKKSNPNKYDIMNLIDKIVC
uniref:Uncharacterized protein n=1 Tax=viral metagenome TaxID=1070528 RepID=A0A6M3Y769_9ZZZZ